MATELFRAHYENVRRAVTRWAGADLADEGAAFAFLQVAAGKLASDHPAPFAWLVTVAKHHARHLAKRARRVDSLDVVDVDQALAGHLADPALIAEVDAALALVGELKPAEARVLFQLWAGYSYQEISEREGQTYTWVNRYASEGRKHLRRLAGN